MWLRCQGHELAQRVLNVIGKRRVAACIRLETDTSHVVLQNVPFAEESTANHQGRTALARTKQAKLTGRAGTVSSEQLDLSASPRRSLRIDAFLHESQCFKSAFD